MKPCVLVLLLAIVAAALPAPVDLQEIQEVEMEKPGPIKPTVVRVAMDPIPQQSVAHAVHAQVPQTHQPAAQDQPYQAFYPHTQPLYAPNAFHYEQSTAPSAPPAPEDLLDHIRRNPDVFPHLYQAPPSAPSYAHVQHQAAEQPDHSNQVQGQNQPLYPPIPKFDDSRPVFTYESPNVQHKSSPHQAQAGLNSLNDHNKKKGISKTNQKAIIVVGSLAIGALATYGMMLWRDRRKKIASNSTAGAESKVSPPTFSAPFAPKQPKRLRRKYKRKSVFWWM